MPLYASVSFAGTAVACCWCTASSALHDFPLIELRALTVHLAVHLSLPTCVCLFLHLPAPSCRERLLSSVSLYAIARHAYQEAEYDEAIIALEESLALRLFAYADQKTLDRWQQGLVMPGSLFRRQKMDLANMLVLRSDCLVQLARVSGSSSWCTAGAAAAVVSAVSA